MVVLSIDINAASCVKFQTIHFSIHNIVCVVIITGYVIQSLAKWEFGPLNTKTKKNKQRVDYEPYSDHGHAVNKVNAKGYISPKPKDPGLNCCT